MGRMQNKQLSSSQNSSIMNSKASKHPFLPLLFGKGVSKGIAVGPAFVFKPLSRVPVSTPAPKDAATEIARFKDAQKKVLVHLEALVEKTKADIGAHEAEIFEAHQMMVQDEELVSPILFAIEQDPATNMSLSSISEPVILVAEDLTPSQTILLDRKNILGLITEKGGETSHSAIIARTLGIPAISGIDGALEKIQAKSLLAIDGGEGSLFSVAEPPAFQHFKQAAEKQTAEKQKLRVFKGKPSITQDLHKMSLYANIGNLKDATAAKDGDAEGVGLFRTEFLFMDRNVAPTLEEQRSAYFDVLNLMAPKEVVIRTLDVGGDKPIDYINIPKEENPFLGVRAIRYCMKDIPLFKTQIKAMLLANEQGNLAIMTPMVSRASEAAWAKKIIQECHEELKADTSYKQKAFRVGTMVEIPSLIFEMRELKASVSFVSVGTNDLTQYSLAVDRMNPALQDLYSPYNLGFIRMMNLLAEQAIENGLELGICGELGGKDEFIPLWVAMGYQKLSMIGTEVLTKRALLSKLTVLRCKALLKEVTLCQNEVEVRSRLLEFLEREKNR